MAAVAPPLPILAQYPFFPGWQTTVRFCHFGTFWLLAYISCIARRLRLAGQPLEPCAICFPFANVPPFQPTLCRAQPYLSFRLGLERLTASFPR